MQAKFDQSPQRSGQRAGVHEAPERIAGSQAPAKQREE
jgi:hypothetical protein